MACPLRDTWRSQLRRRHSGTELQLCLRSEQYLLNCVTIASLQGDVIINMLSRSASDPILHLPGLLIFAARLCESLAMQFT